MHKAKFEYYHVEDDRIIPDHRKPVTGIEILRKYKFHSNYGILHTNVDQPPTGPEPVKGVNEIIRSSFPQYVETLDSYCRPKSDVDAIFADFNHPTKPITEFSSCELQSILEAVDHFMAIAPYDIVHWCDTRFYPWTFSSKADYYHLHNKERSKLASLNHPPDKVKPSSKGFYVNVHLFHDRATTHQIKEYGYPFVPSDNTSSNESRLFHWFLSHPTELLVRSHISKRDKLKVRPVYNAPYLLVRLELMLLWPMMAQCRNPDNSLMYGLETIRGGMEEIERQASQYHSYIMIDWSKFDHDAPFSIIDTFFTHFLPSKICIDKGYARIHNYREHVANFEQQSAKYGKSHLTQDEQSFPSRFATKVSNLINFVHRWYKEMIFITPDGYAYRRKNAGVPSGILATQLLDSYVNIFVICSCLLKYGLTLNEIKSCKLHILGDDVALFTPFSTDKATHIFEFIRHYSSKRFHMTVNETKSCVSGTRTRIEILGYRNNYGYPYKDIEKLAAQLAYPEHHVNDEIMCARAVGIVLASAGTDTEFYHLCKAVYQHYEAKLHRPLQHGLIQSMLYRIFRYIPYEYIDKIFPSLVKFPTLDEIRCIYTSHKGYLSFDSCWPREYFIDGPFSPRSDYITLLSAGDPSCPDFKGRVSTTK